MKGFIKFSIIALTVISTGCMTVAPAKSRSVSRIDSDAVVDLSGRWNDTDSKNTARAMIEDVISRPWIDDFRYENDRKPVVIVGSIRNKSSEHIDTGIFVKDLERELINSGRVKFVASRNERDEIREEREDQLSNASVETAKRLAQETGADFMLIGTIRTQNDAYDNVKVKFYQIDMELIHLETNEKVWIGSHEEKKLLEQDKVSW